MGTDRTDRHRQLEGNHVALFPRSTDYGVTLLVRDVDRLTVDAKPNRVDIRLPIQGPIESVLAAGRPKPTGDADAKRELAGRRRIDRDLNLPVDRVVPVSQARPRRGAGGGC